MMNIGVKHYIGGGVTLMAEQGMTDQRNPNHVWSDMVTVRMKYHMRGAKAEDIDSCLEQLAALNLQCGNVFKSRQEIVSFLTEEDAFHYEVADWMKELNQDEIENEYPEFGDLKIQEQMRWLQMAKDASPQEDADGQQLLAQRMYKESRIPTGKEKSGFMSEFKARLMRVASRMTK